MNRMTLPNQLRPSLNETLAGELGHACDVIRSAIGEESPIAWRMSVLRERLQQRQMQIAVLGQFKRGKSTFVNALLGAPVLPTAVVPLTAIPTFIAWGNAPSVEVRFTDGRPSQRFMANETVAIRDVLSRFVTEESNPKNRLQVERVDLLYPAEILADGTVLIDTPGIGSTLAHNTEAAFRVLPECDASLFIVSADPPITETEVAYLRRLKPKVGRTFFIVNKIDYLTAEDRQNVVGFLRKVLSEEAFIEPNTTIFCISAQAALSAKLANDSQALSHSGIVEIERCLTDYLGTEKDQALNDAIKRKAADLVEQAISELELRARAFQMPLEELQQKSAAFAGSLHAISDQRVTIGDLLSGDKRRLVDDLEARIVSFRGAALAKLITVIDERLAHGQSDWQSDVKSVLSVAIEGLFTDATKEFVDSYSEQAKAVLSAHTRRIDTLVEEVRSTAAQTFDVVLAPERDPDEFQVTQDPYWVTERIASALIPDFGRFVDRLLPADQCRRRRRQRIIGEANELIIRNAENLRWAILRGLEETFRAAIAHFEDRLNDAIMATKGIIEDALAQRRDRAFSVEPIIGRVRRSIEELGVSRGAFGAVGG